MGADGHFLWFIELAYRILSSLPRSRLAGIQRRIAPLLQFDLVGVRKLSNLYVINDIEITLQCVVYSLSQQKLPSRFSPTFRRRFSSTAASSANAGAPSRMTKLYGRTSAARVGGNGSSQHGCTTLLLSGLVIWTWRIRTTRAWATTRMI